MNVCDLISGATVIQRSTRKLSESWRQTKEYWQDANSEQFEKEYLRSLATVVNNAILATRKMDKLLKQAQRDCADVEDA